MDKISNEDEKNRIHTEVEEEEEGVREIKEKKELKKCNNNKNLSQMNSSIFSSDVYSSRNSPSTMPIKKYMQFQPLEFDELWTQRKWPEKQIHRAPRWCSVDLRDGNQALTNPMTVEKKLKLFFFIVKMGYKEIEVAFPAASQMDFDFCRELIDNHLVPDDVWIGVLVQARESLISATIEAVRGAKNVIIHMYNSTSTLQRDVVFGLSCDEIKSLAVKGCHMIRRLVDERLRPQGTRVRLEYSPESFTGTEMSFALEICHAVMDEWQPSYVDPIIFNLPATVEMTTPNVYADQIEWMGCHLKDRKKIVLSIHPHNDRGCAVAAAELAISAGADRVEGCLFGNGERTGNVCLVTLALNLFTQGVDPEIDCSDMPSIVEVYETCTGMRVPERYPYAGKLVFTAFSGSHQDAIKKGMAAVRKRSDQQWHVPYLLIDPKDIGQTYKELVRLNSQSGKGGIAFVMEKEFGITLPRSVQVEFSQVVQRVTDETAKEITPNELYVLFEKTYLSFGKNCLVELLDYRVEFLEGEEPKKRSFSLFPNSPRACESKIVQLNATLSLHDKSKQVDVIGTGIGPVAAFVSAINKYFDVSGFFSSSLKVTEYHQDAVGLAKEGSESESVCFVQLNGCCGELTLKHFGVGIDRNTTTASLKAICNSANRLYINLNDALIV